MEPLQFRLLGPIEVTAGNEVLAVGSPQQRVVLALLALRRGTVVPTDSLIDALWDGAPPPTAAATVRTLMARLRRTLAPLGDVPISGRESGYILDVAPDQVDAHCFTRLTEAGRGLLTAGRLQEAAETLRAALDLWRGPALGELAEREFARAEVRRLEEAHHGAVEDLAEAELGAGRAGEALARLEDLLDRHPLRERAWGQRMLALYRLGRQAEALRAFQAVRRVLRDELGIDPSLALRDLETRILRQDPTLRPDEPQRNNLPVALTSFIGREQEVKEVDGLLSESRLLTLAGVGGAGKTRLALEAAMAAGGRFRDGVWLAELGSLSDPELVVAEVAEAIGLRSSSLSASGRSILDALAEHLGRRQLLLVLDNCEHLVAAVAELAHRVLSRCPDVVVMATSREVLGVPGERVFRVPPLGESDAVTLFCERASMAQPGFSLNAANADAVTRICRRLDGIPLALELAAARVPMLGAQQIAARIDQALSLLSGGGRTVVARHQTLRAAIDWSYRLLPPAEQLVLQRLSVFPGTFGLEAAAAVVADPAPGLTEPGQTVEVLDRLTRLADKSLLIPVPQESKVRYRLLETIREYAGEQLAAAGEAEERRQRHHDFFLALADAGRTLAWEHFRMGSWLQAVGPDHDNFRTALQWALDRDDDEAILRFAASLWQYWLIFGVVEGRQWVERAVAAPGSSFIAERATVCFGWGDVQREAGRDIGAQWIQQLEDQLAVTVAAGEAKAAGGLYIRLSEARLAQGRIGEAEQLVNQALESCDPQGTTFCLLYRSWVRIRQDDLAGAFEDLDRALALERQSDDAFVLAHLFAQQAVVCALAGDAEGAEQMAIDAVAAARRFPGRHLLLVMALLRAADGAILTGRLERARAPLAELLEILRNVGTRRWVAEGLEMAAVVLAAGCPEAAGSLLGAAESLRESLGEPLQAGALASRVERCRSLVAESLGAATLEERRRSGRDLTADEAMEFALVQLTSAQGRASAVSRPPAVPGTRGRRGR